MRVRVITFNVWNVEGESRRHQIINQELRRLKPDLLALQEVIQTPTNGSLTTIGQRNYHRRFDCVLVGSWDAHPKAGGWNMAKRPLPGHGRY
jgi:exonuclease III